ncbi:extracellular solute-binding protein [Microbacteriaceae bacterium VKM Ac-2854]|nr:extracellular solute-binding protein [Microbacteriaceae bacterium VKM Ac-2854]
MPPRPPLNGALSRRSLLAAAGLGAAALGLSACASSGGGGVTTIRFFQTKPEVVGYFDDIITGFHEAQDAIRVVHDSTSQIAPMFVRGNPPDLALLNYDLEVARYIPRGVFSDLSDMPEAQRIQSSVQALVDQYATYEDTTSVLPYSIAAEGVIYNKTLFAQNGIEVPTTYSELLAACEAFAAAGIVPIYSTFKDPWTIRQGLFDYSVGGAVDVDAFFTDLAAEGSDISATSGTSFEKNLADPIDKMIQLAGFANQDAGSRGYADGNLAFAQGTAAMLMQGPWAFGEIAKTAPDLDLGVFPLPMTEDPTDLKTRVNLDLAAWIPEASKQKDAARVFLSYLMSPEIIDSYNADNLGFGVTTDAPPATDPKITALQPLIDAGAFYQGAGTYIPNTIPVMNYLQAAVRSGDGAAMLQTLDADWRRIALRS